MAIPLDSHFIPAFSIEDVLLDKDTGAPLSGGLVYFEQDNQRGTPKNVWQITGTSPNYSFIQLPNPMTLSSIGTFVDSLDNPVIPYFYPYDSAGDVELYYVRVTSSEDVTQFVREAVPYIADSGSSSVSSAFVNEISNPQFAEILFTTPTNVYSYNAASLVVTPIAPGWDLVVSSAAAATVTVTQLTPAGSLNRISNPGTILTISSAGVSRLRLRQRIYGSPNLWGSGYITGSFVAKTYSGSDVTLTMYYSQSNGIVVNIPIVAGTLLSDGLYATHTDSVLIPASTSTQFYPDAYIDIEFDIPLSITIDLTSVMIAHTGDVSINTITYDQESNDRQIDHLFHYYKPQLEYKPISSLLTGWDFPLNPAQTGSTKTITTTPAYIWDQTICKSTVGNVAVIKGTTSGAFVATTANANESIYLLQYLSGAQALETTLTNLSVNISGNVSFDLPCTVRVYLYYSNGGGTIPVLSTTIGTMAASGEFTVTPLNNWALIPNIYFNTSSALNYENATTSDTQFNGFNGQAYLGATATANFAIVVTFFMPTSGSILNVESISLIPGDIPTRPAPQSPDEVLRECSVYYQKSFATNVVPASAVGLPNASTSVQVAGAGLLATLGPIIRFPVEMRTTPSITLYNPGTAGSQIWNNSVGSWSSSLADNVGNKGFSTAGTTPAGSSFNQGAYVHWTANAQLGIV